MGVGHRGGLEQGLQHQGGDLMVFTWDLGGREFDDRRLRWSPGGEGNRSTRLVRGAPAGCCRHFLWSEFVQ